MTEAPATTQKMPISLAKRLKIAGILIVLGLIVEGLSLVWLHPLSFVVFIAVGGSLLAAGIVLYLWSLVSHGPS